PNETSSDAQSTDSDDFNVGEYFQDDNINDYGSSGSRGSDDDAERKEITIAVHSSFFEILTQQLESLELSDNDLLIALQIIGSLYDDGYLRRPIESLIDDLAFSQNVVAEEEEVLSVLDKVQQFDPAGVAARDLQECLLIQLRKKNSDNPTIKNA